MKNIRILLLISVLYLCLLSNVISTETQLKLTKHNLHLVKVDSESDRTISMVEILIPGLTFPSSKKFNEIPQKVFGEEDTMKYQMQSDNLQYTKNQMTVLGYEVFRRHANFFNQLSAKSIKSKIHEDNDLNRVSLESHLNGLGNVWKDMKDVDPFKVSKDEVIPPIKQTTNDWRFSLGEWLADKKLSEQASKFSLESIDDIGVKNILLNRNKIKEISDDVVDTPLPKNFDYGLNKSDYENKNIFNEKNFLFDGLQHCAKTLRKSAYKFLNVKSDMSHGNLIIRINNAA